MIVLLIGWFIFIWYKELVVFIFVFIVGIILNFDVIIWLVGNIDIVSLIKVFSYVGYGLVVFIMYV